MPKISDLDRFGAVYHMLAPLRYIGYGLAQFGTIWGTQKPAKGGSFSYEFPKVSQGFGSILVPETCEKPWFPHIDLLRVYKGLASFGVPRKLRK